MNDVGNVKFISNLDCLSLLVLGKMDRCHLSCPIRPPGEMWANYILWSAAGRETNASFGEYSP